MHACSIAKLYLTLCNSMDQVPLSMGFSRADIICFECKRIQESCLLDSTRLAQKFVQIFTQDHGEP